MRWDWKRDGDEFLFTFVDCGIAVGFQEIEEQRDGLHADMLVKSTIPSAPAHVHYCRLNLASSSTRERLVTTLNGLVKNVLWRQVLEICCTKTVIEWRRGDPVLDLAEQPVPSGTAYLVRRLLPEGVPTVLYGDGGTAKSMIALAVAVIVQEKLWLPGGIEAAKPAGVMYLDWETSVEDQTERLAAVSAGLGLTGRSHIYYRRMFRPLADEATRIRDDVKRNGVGLVIVDSLGFACGGNPKDADTALSTMNSFGRIGATSLAIAHITKEEARAENGKASIFGSGFFAFAARSTWEIRRAEESAENELHVALFHRKTNRGSLQRTPIGWTLHFFLTEDGERLRKVEFAPYEVADDPELAPHASLGFRLRAALKKANGSPLTAEALAERTGGKEKTIRRTLERMKDALNLGRGQGSVGLWVLRTEQQEEMRQ